MHCNGSNSYIFINGIEIHKFKAKDSEIHAGSTDNTKKTGLYVYVYDFSVEHNVIAFDDILDIHKYLMKKHNVK